jgi:hypothetical protein
MYVVFCVTNRWSLFVSVYCVPSMNWLTLWSWALLKRPPVVRPLDSFPAFYGTRRFITTFTRALHVSLSWARPIHSTPPQDPSWYYPPTYDWVSLGLFPPDFSTNNLYAFLFSPIHAKWPAHLILLDLIVLIILGKEYKSRRMKWRSEQ